MRRVVFHKEYHHCPNYSPYTQHSFEGKDTVPTETKNSQTKANKQSTTELNNNFTNPPKGNNEKLDNTTNLPMQLNIKPGKNEVLDNILYIDIIIYVTNMEKISPLKLVDDLPGKIH